MQSGCRECLIPFSSAASPPLPAASAVLCLVVGELRLPQPGLWLYLSVKTEMKSVLKPEVKTEQN